MRRHEKLGPVGDVRVVAPLRVRRIPLLVDVVEELIAPLLPVRDLGALLEAVFAQASSIEELLVLAVDAVNHVLDLLRESLNLDPRHPVFLGCVGQGLSQHPQLLPGLIK